MPIPLTRREFIASTSAATGLMILTRPGAARTYRANERLALGVIGVGGRGADNLAAVAGESVVALCDVDADLLGAAAKANPGAKTYRDFRRMIEAGGLDAVVVSTPDHTHAAAAARALRAGLHVYCEKPLAHTVREAQVLERLARAGRRATQLGTQIHAGENYRRVVELVQSGAIGAVREVHVWCGGGFSGGERPADRPAVPANLDWDLWLGPAPERPYHPAYVPFHWRGWWDFGNGTLGDLACHHMDLSFWALHLGRPTAVEAEGPPVHQESCPAWLVVRYEFPAAGPRPAVPLTWYHGDRRPPQFKDGLLPEWGNGTLFVGEKGMLLADYDRRVLLPEERYRGFSPPPQTLAPSPGHHAEWLTACKTGAPTTCDFAYSGPLTEAVLLGNVAYRAGERLVFDGPTLRGSARAEALLGREARAGW